VQTWRSARELLQRSALLVQSHRVPTELLDLTVVTEVKPASLSIPLLPQRLGETRSIAALLRSLDPRTRQFRTNRLRMALLKLRRLLLRQSSTRHLLARACRFPGRQLVVCQGAVTATLQAV
jgi:hypothetical protein